MVNNNNKLLYLTCITMFVSGTMESMKGFLPIYFKNQFAFSSSSTGFIFAASFIGLMLANMISGQFVSMWGWKRSFVFHMLLFSAGWWVIAIFSPGALFVWIVLFLVIGFANGINGMISNVIGPISNPEKAGKLLGRIHFFFGSGLIVGPMLFSRIQHQQLPQLDGLSLQWPGAFIIYGLLGLSLAVIAWRLKWASVETAHKPSEVNVVNGTGTQETTTTVNYTRIMISFAALYFCYVGAEVGVTVWYITLFDSHYKLTPEMASTWFSLGFALFTFARLAVHRLVAITGYEGGLKICSLSAFACLSWANLIPGMIGAAGYIAFLFCIAMIFPLMTAFAVKITGTLATKRMGWFFAFGFAGGAFVSWAVGFLQTVVTIRSAFLIVSLFFLVFCLVLFQLIYYIKDKQLSRSYVKD